MKYRKVVNTLNGKVGYISLNYFINHGIYPFKFLESGWVPFVPKGYEFI